MAKNRNCYFALGMERSETAYVKPIEGYYLWHQDFSLSMDFYILQESKEMCLFSQEGIMEAGYNTTGFYIRVGDNTYAVTESDMAFLPRAWNNLTITFQKETGNLVAYINGVKGFYKQAVVPAEEKQAEYVVGKDFYGYIRKVKCLGRLLTEEESRKEAMVEPEAPEQYEFYMDFTGKYPKELGKHSLTILLTGFCAVKNLVQTIEFGDTGYILPDTSDYVEAGTVSSEEFTILSKVYLKDSRSRHILFSRQEKESSYGIVIGMDYTSGKPKIFVRYGTEEVLIECAMDLYSWFDIAVSYGNGTLGVYLDGILVEEHQVQQLKKDCTFADITIGNTGKANEYPSFCGYIDYVSLFNNKKTEEQLASYTLTQPFVFSDGISALYRMSDLQLYEYVNNTALNLMKQARQVLAEDTQDEVAIDSKGYEEKNEDDIQIGDYDYWKAGVVAASFVQTVGEMGIQPTKGFHVDGTLKKAAAKELLTDVVKLPSAQQLIINHKNITPNLIEGFLKELCSSGLYSCIWNIFFSASSQISAFFSLYGQTILAVIASVMASVVGYVSLMSLVAVSVSAILAESIKDPDESENDDDDNKDEDVSIRILSIRFCHNASNLAESAAFLYHGYTASEEASPEWEQGSEEKKITDALYIALKAKTVKVIAKFKITLNGDKPYSGNIWATSGSQTQTQGILGNLSSVHVDVAETCEKEITFSLEQTLFCEKQGCYYDYWNWQADQCGVFAETEHHTWILQNEPSREWNINSEEKTKNVSVETLSILKEVMEYDSSDAAGEKLELNSQETWLKQMVYFIHDSGHFSYNYDQAHLYTCKRQFPISIFYDRERMERDYVNKRGTQEKTYLSSCDSSMFMKAWLSLMGYEVFLGGIWGEEGEWVYNKDETEEGFIPSQVFFSNINVMGSSGYDMFSIPVEYYTVLSDSSEKALVYDGIVLAQDVKKDGAASKNYITGLPFTPEKYQKDFVCTETNHSFYRESCTMPGMNFYLGFTIQVWEMGSIPEKDWKPSVTSFKYEADHIVFNKRDEVFSDSFKTSIDYKTPEYNILAHKVSYAYIRSAIQTTTNQAIDKIANTTDTKVIDNAIAVFNYLMKILYRLICGVNETGVAVFTGDQKIYNYVVNQLIPLEDFLKNKNTADKRFTDILNAILKELFSTNYNVKIGNNRWNASLGESFDLEANWGIIIYQRDQFGRLCGGNTFGSLSVYNYADCYTHGFGMGLYLSEADSNRIKLMKKIYDYNKDMDILRPKIRVIYMLGGVVYFAVNTDRGQDFEMYQKAQTIGLKIYDCTGIQLLP